MVHFTWDNFNKRYRIGVGDTVIITGEVHSLVSIQKDRVKLTETVTLKASKGRAKNMNYENFIKELEKHNENNIYLISNMEADQKRGLLGKLFKKDKSTGKKYVYPNYDPDEYIAEVKRSMEKTTAPLALEFAQKLIVIIERHRTMKWEV